jgi:hypothetical protein
MLVCLSALVLVQGLAALLERLSAEPMGHRLEFLLGLLMLFLSSEQVSPPWRP